LNYYNLENNDVLFYIKGTVNNIEELTNITNVIYGEVGNGNDEIVSDITLSLPQLSPENSSNVNSFFKNVLIYPNPANNFVFINNAENSKVEIYDVFGKVVLSKNIENNNTKIEINELLSGTYIIKIYKNNELFINKFIIVK